VQQKWPANTPREGREGAPPPHPAPPPMRRSRPPLGYIRSRGAQLLVNSLIFRELSKGVGVVCEAKAFLCANSKKRSAPQRILKQANHPVLQRLIEIDQHVSARYEMHFAEGSIGHQAVVGKYNALAKAPAEGSAAIRRRIII